MQSFKFLININKYWGKKHIECKICRICSIFAKEENLCLP